MKKILLTLAMVLVFCSKSIFAADFCNKYPVVHGSPGQQFWAEVRHMNPAQLSKLGGMAENTMKLVVLRETDTDFLVELARAFVEPKPVESSESFVNGFTRFRKAMEAEYRMTRGACNAIMAIAAYVPAKPRYTWLAGLSGNRLLLEGLSYCNMRYSHPGSGAGLSLLGQLYSSSNEDLVRIASYSEKTFVEAFNTDDSLLQIYLSHLMSESPIEEGYKGAAPHGVAALMGVRINIEKGVFGNADCKVLMQLATRVPLSNERIARMAK